MQTVNFDLSRLYEQNPPLFYQKDSVRETAKKISLIAAGVFFLGYLGSISLLKATPAVLGFTVRFFRNSSVFSGITALLLRFVNRGIDHPESVRKLEKLIAHKLDRNEGLNRVLNEHPEVEAFVKKDRANRQKIAEYLDTKIKEGALSSVWRCKEFYKNEGNYVDCMSQESNFTPAAKRASAIISDYKREKKGIKNQSAALKEQVKRQHGVLKLEQDLRNKQNALFRVQEEKRSSGFDALGGVSGAIGHFDNDKKVREQSHYQTELHELKYERVLQHSQRERLEALQRQIHDLKISPLQYQDLSSRELEIESLEREVNSILYNRWITHKELNQQRISLESKISSLQPQSKCSTALHVGSAALNTWKFFNLDNQIQNLRDEIKELNEALQLAERKMRPEINALDEKLQKTITENKLALEKSLQHFIKNHQ